MAITLRELNGQADAERCAALEHVLFKGENPWPVEAFLDEFARPYTFYVGAELDGEFAGYAGIAMMGPADSPEFEIHTIGTDPAFQRRGVARALMDNIVYIADLKKAPIFLEVRVGNEPAIALYEAYGFQHMGIRKNYYQPAGLDAHTMMRPAAEHTTEATIEETIEAKEN